MADFYQNGIVTTLHNLTRRPVEELDQELLSFSEKRPLGLILPSLYSELEGEALPKIVEGRINGFYKDVALLDQPYAKDDKQSVSQFIGGATIVAFAQVEIG